MDDTQEGKIADAIRLARSSVAIAPGVEESHRALAKALQAHGQFADAFAEYKIALSLDPGNSELHRDVGRFFMAQHKQSLQPFAVAQFRKAVELAPQEVDPHHYLAEALAMQGRYDEAIEQWKIAVSLNPGFGIAQRQLGEALRLKGDSKGAIEHDQAALAAGDSDPTMKANLVLLIASDPASSQQRIADVLPLAEQACEQTGAQSPIPLRAYATALARLGQFNTAIQAATAELRLAETANQTDQANAIRARIEQYRKCAVR